MKRATLLLLATALAPMPLAARQAAPLQKAIVLGPERVYLSPDSHSSRVGSIAAGDQIGVQSVSGTYTQVYSGISGWIADHNYVLLSDPKADEIILGAAVQLERQAYNDSSDAETASAVRLYLSVYNFLPQSPRAAEALYRGAALQWDTKVSELPRRTSPSFRLFPDDNLLRKVEGKFHGTPWAQRAAYKLLITHFDCGDWFEKPSCIGKEADRYRDYVKQYPSSPVAAEAAFDALYREGIAWTIYSQPGKNQDLKQAADFQQRVASDAASLQQAYPNSDWSARGAYLAFQVAHNSPLPLPPSTPLGGP